MRVSPFLDRKLTRRFATFDLDDNGFVEWTDFERGVHQLGAAFGHDSGSPPLKRLHDLSRQLWDHLAKVADADNDGRISETEYKAAFAAGLLESPGSFEAGYVPFLDAIMEIADTDGDGVLNRDEYVKWSGAMLGLDAEVAAGVFARLDADGDGRVTRQQVLEAIRVYYFDENPESAGSWLLGPLQG